MRSSTRQKSEKGHNLLRLLARLPGYLPQWTRSLNQLIVAATAHKSVRAVAFIMRLAGRVEGIHWLLGSSISILVVATVVSVNVSKLEEIVAGDQGEAERSEEAEEDELHGVLAGCRLRSEGSWILNRTSPPVGLAPSLYSSCWFMTPFHSEQFFCHPRKRISSHAG